MGDAILNLAINARDAMPYGGTISIATANTHLGSGRQPDEEVKSGDYVMLVGERHRHWHAAETGPALEPFFTTKAMRHGGSGLGLTQIYGFAKQSGGTFDR